MADITEPLEFTSRGNTLRGTWTRPEDVDAPPTALLLPGSGPLDRDGNHARLPLAIQRHLADLLSGLGWATMRYDKAGVGESGGDYLSTSLSEEGDDAGQALAWVQVHAEGAAIAVVGHSAGCLHAARLAAAHPDLAGVALLSGPAQRGETVLRWQAAQIAPTLPRAARAVMRVTGTSLTRQQSKAIAKLRATTRSVARIGGAKTNAAWMREYLDHDPLDDLAQVRVPVFAATGTKDIQVDWRDLDVMKRTVAGPITTVAARDVDHILRDETGELSRPQRYRKQASARLSEHVTQPLSAWLRGRQ